MNVKSQHRVHTSVRGMTWLEFCLRPRRVTRPVTLVRVMPGGVSLSLGRGRKLMLAGRLATRTTTTGHGPVIVRVLLDRLRARAAVLVGDRRLSVPASIPAVVRVYVGSTRSAPARRPGAPGVSGASSTPTAAPGAPDTNKSPWAGWTAAQASAATAWPGDPFAPTSFWNAPLPRTAAIDPSSQAYVDDLVSQVHQFGAWMNTNTYSVPMYVVPAGQPTLKVTLDTWGPDLQATWDSVPIPVGAVAAKGTDESMSVWQPSTNKMWEFWLMHQVNGAWHARWGGEMDNASTSPGYYSHAGQTDNWGGTGTGLALAGGLITLADLQRGYINHALALAVPQTRAHQFSWPAQRTDGNSTAAAALPEGIRFRLDPTINCGGLGLPWLDRVLCQAAQTFGIVVRDTSGAVTFYAQDPTPTGTNPWAAPFDGWSEGTFLSWLPWSHLQALKTQLSG